MKNKDNQWLDSLIEELADIEHQRWADWQKWCHKVLRDELRYNDMETNLDEILARWDRQIETPYSELSEKEKQSDRDQVNRYLPLIQAHIDTIVIEARIDELENTMPYTDGMRHYNTVKKRIAELKSKIGESDDQD